MSAEQKVSLAEGVWETYGLEIALEAVALPKSTWYYHQNQKRSYAEKYAHLRETLETIAREHPEYGYRRVASELRDSYGLEINHKVVQRLQGEWELSILRNTPAPKAFPTIKIPKNAVD
jgi:putative transposase